MKSKKFEDLRGTNTAVHCPTQEDWDKVSEICEYKWESNANWSDCGPDTVISLRSIAHGVYDGFFSKNGYTIIPAADFIAANTEQAPDLTGTRPAIEWLQFLPEPYRGKALEAVKVAPNEPNRLCSYQNCINYAIDWANTNEDSDFWIAINAHLQDPSNPLPPLPSEGVEAEKVDAETDIQKLIKILMIKFAEQEKRLQLMTDLHDKLQGKVESLEKQLSEKPDTTQPAISPTPAEPEVKLPVTIEEVTDFQESLLKEEQKLFQLEVVKTFINEKTLKKTSAFEQLSQISEAQNEIAPRGETVWVAYREKERIEIINYSMDMLDIEIFFHSEQGLKDCIEANRELWMDLLKGE
jgi:hypothetical protein